MPQDSGVEPPKQPLIDPNHPFKLGTLTDGDALRYVDANKDWENKPIPSGGSWPPEGNYTVYTKLTDVNLDASDLAGNVGIMAIIIDEAAGIVISFDSNNNLTNIADIDGSSNSDIFPTQIAFGPVSPLLSVASKYIITAPFASMATLDVIKDGIIIQIIDVSAVMDSSLNGSCWTVSPTGKYIACMAGSISDSKKRHMVVYQGS